MMMLSYPQISTHGPRSSCMCWSYGLRSVCMPLDDMHTCWPYLGWLAAGGCWLLSSSCTTGCGMLDRTASMIFVSIASSSGLTSKQR